MRENHTQKFGFCSFLSFFLSFFLEELYLKTIACMRILHMPNDCSATWHLPFLAWGGIWATTGELRPRNFRLLFPKMLCVLGRRLLFNQCLTWEFTLQPKIIQIETRPFDGILLCACRFIQIIFIAWFNACVNHWTKPLFKNVYESWHQACQLMWLQATMVP